MFRGSRLRIAAIIFSCLLLLFPLFYHWKISSKLESPNEFASGFMIQLDYDKTNRRMTEDLSLQQLDARATSSLPSMTCSSRVEIANSDINMLDVYDDIKFENIDGGKWKQGWNLTYSMNLWEDRPLEVVILPHSHQDPGWIRTFDEYFDAQTKPSLDSTLDFLGKNENGRFIYAEVSFLDKWWSKLSPSEKAAFTKLVSEGKWEIGTGGWVMNDEATSHYAATITQLTEGQHWLMDNLGYFPNVSWAVDPFGHSTSEAYLLRKVGIKHMLIQRVHYEVKKYLALNKNLEFTWKQPWDKSGEGGIFCHVMPFYSYDVPHTCGPDPSVCCQFDFFRMNKYHCPWGIDPVAISDQNIKFRAIYLADQYKKKAMLYDNNDVVLITLGDDFRFTSKEEWELQIRNYEKLMNYINANPDFQMHIQFGTLSTYFNLVHSRDHRKHFPTLIGDLFTYADRDQHYWSGYYTTRPTHKALSRALESELRYSEILFSFARHWLSSDLSKKTPEVFVAMYDLLRSSRRNLSLFQHHDGVTGTARTHVMADYKMRLLDAVNSSRTVAAAALTYLLGSDNKDIGLSLKNQFLSKNGPPVLACAGFDFSASSLPQRHSLSFNQFGESKDLIIFNTLPWNRDIYVSVHVMLSSPLHAALQSSFSIRMSVATADPDVDFSGKFQLEPVFESPIVAALQKHSYHPLVFLLHAGPFGMKPLQISRVSVGLLSTKSATPSIEIIKPTLYAYKSLPPAHLHTLIKASPVTLTLSNDFYRLNFDTITGFLQTLLNRKFHNVHPLSIGFRVLKSKLSKEMSGAYLLIPALPSLPFPLNDPAQIRVSNGPAFDEITTYHDRLEHTVRLYKSGGLHGVTIEVENTLSLSDPHNNEEVLMVIKTGINNANKVFYTDSNCLQFTRRAYYEKIPFQGNVYPMSCAVYIQDERYRFTVLSAQSLGVVAGTEPGEIQIWLDRRLAQDDNLGLLQPILDNVPTRSKFRFLLESIDSGSGVNHDLFLPGLTYEGISLLNDLVNPTALFTLAPDVSKDVAHQLKSGLLLMSPNGLPCDYELVSLKTFYSPSNRFSGLSSSPNSQLGLLLHRTLPYCGKTYLCKSCNCPVSESSSLSVADLFPSLALKTAVKTSLTFIPDMHSKVPVKLSNISVQPMELEAFLLLPDSS